MIELIIFILAATGMTNIIVRESIFGWLRKWINKVFPYSMLNKILKCPTCCGFWVGLIIALMFPSLGINWFIAGCISSITNKLVFLYLIPTF